MTDSIMGLAKQTVYSLQHEGIKPTIRKAGIFIKCNIGKKGKNKINEYKDVLFISGCNYALPHSHRYRVSNQIEQLDSMGIKCDDIYYLDLSCNMVKYYSNFVFYRCPYTEIIDSFIKEAKFQNKTVFFDVDDLVIDTKYTDTIPFVKSMDEYERKLYDDGVKSMGKTLSLCDYAITTTEELASELSKYIKEVYVNRNTASEEMVECSQIALSQKASGMIVVKKNKRENQEILQDNNILRMGYFSGSITHNDDFKMILPVVVKIMNERQNVRLCLVGELDIPDELSPFKERIDVFPFVDYRELPKLICSVDINLIPLVDSIFNRSKSENKWVEAALVKVPSIASNVGAFSKCISDNETGVLCDNNVNDWYEKILLLIDDENLRRTISQNAYDYCSDCCITTKTALGIAGFIRDKQAPSFAMVLPSTEISGGVIVALKHCEIMRKSGYNVLVIASYPTCEFLTSGDEKFAVIWMEKEDIVAGIDKMVATMWTTVHYMLEQKNVADRYYLVQGYEADFYDENTPEYTKVIETYNKQESINYVTISKWCEEWLKNKFEIRNVRFAPNGIERDAFYYKKRNFDGKIRILIEGDSEVDYKNVDESFMITNQLDKNKYEIWYLSYNGKPKKWYRYDKFIHKVEYSKMPEIYHQCHILIKTSLLESFSYPPLEMMATGGFVVMISNDGNKQFALNNTNCLTFDHGDMEGALTCIERIVSDEQLREKLSKNGIRTADKRKWDNIKNDIIELYE